LVDAFERAAELQEDFTDQPVSRIPVQNAIDFEHGFGFLVRKTRRPTVG
jgi:hypothetical protein